MLNSAFYYNCPVWLQELLIYGHARLRTFFREGAEFRELLSDCQERQWSSSKELKTYAESQALAITRHAAKHVPFYAQLYKERGISQEIFDDFSSWHQLPTLDKGMARRARSSLLASNIQTLRFRGSTSGTSGSPLVISQNLHAINRENAFIWRQLSWAGIKRGDRRAWIRGDMPVHIDCTAPPFWRMNRAENMMVFSSYHLSQQHAEGYLKTLTRFDPIGIQAYPSSISFLATYLNNLNQCYSGTSLKGIITSSESLSDDQRETIERVFRCKVFDWYGQFERVAAIGTCEHRRYHLISDYGFTELVPVKGGLFEIVGTGFNNWAMPLIRYRTGDLVEIENSEQFCPCGRQFPLIRRVLGRQDDIVKLPDGRHIGRLDHIFKGVSGLLEAQIRQDRLDTILILAVPTKDFNRKTEQRIIHNARNRLGNDISIEVETVSEIQRTDRGKLRGVVCNV